MSRENLTVLWSLESVSLPGRRVPRLDGVTLQIPEGVTAILGQSGSGKTSLLNLLVGYERPGAGTLTSHHKVSTGELSVFWVPPHHGLWTHLTAREHLTTVASTDEQKQTADDFLARFDLRHVASAKPDSLSLGEASRLNVARAIFADPIVLVMDEPLSHVDGARSEKYWSVVREWYRRPGKSLVFATHVPDVVLREASHVICLTDGRIGFCGTTADLYERPSSPDLAYLLGPCNWLSRDDVQNWCPEGVPAPSHNVFRDRTELCLRPERLAIESKSDSPLRVDDVRNSGTTAEVDLHDERSGHSRRFVCRPRDAQRLERGQRVSLKILLLLLIVGLAGCEFTSEPTIPVKRESTWMMPSAGTKVPAPRGMTVSPSNEHLVLDNVGRVLVFNDEGEVLRKWWMPDYSIGKPEGICVLKDGRIAVADTHYHRVVFFDSEGNVTGMFGQHGSEPGDFVYPVKVTQDPDEYIYVCEYGQNDRVQKFRPDGTFVLQFGGPGTEPGQFQRPSGIVWYDHELFVVDAFNNRVQVFKDDGQWVAILGDSDRIAEVHYPYDIAADKNGDLFVVEYGAGRVSKFNRQGHLLGRYGQPGLGQAEGQFSTPWGLAVDRRGRIYVCDTGNRRVVELEL